MKLILSLCGRHRKNAHRRAVKNIKSSSPNLIKIPTLSLGLVYPIIERLGFLKLLLVIIYIVNKVPRMQLLIICSDHALIRKLVKMDPRLRSIVSNRLINLFWNDWRELKPYSIVAQSCYLVGGRASVTREKSYNVAPIFPVVRKNFKRATDLKDKILFIGKAYSDRESIERDMLIHEPTDAMAAVLDELFTSDSFSQLRNKESKFLSDIRELGSETEILSSWAIYRNLCRTLFLLELRDSQLFDNVYVIGTGLKNDFGFNGIENCYNLRRVRKHMIEAKVNLDLGSQVLVSSYYDRSCSILEMAPGSLLQLRQEDSAKVYGSLEQQFTFETMDQFQRLAIQRLGMNASMMSSMDLIISRQIKLRSDLMEMELHFD